MTPRVSAPTFDQNLDATTALIRERSGELLVEINAEKDPEKASSLRQSREFFNGAARMLFFIRIEIKYRIEANQAGTITRYDLQNAIERAAIELLD